MTIIELAVLLAILSVWRLLTLGISHVAGTSKLTAALIALAALLAVWSVPLWWPKLRSPFRPTARVRPDRTRVSDVLTAAGLITLLLAVIGVIVAAAFTLR